MESGMDFDREVSEALDRQAATQALIDAVVVKAAKERKATAAAKAAEKAADKLMKRKRNKSASTAGRQRSQCKDCGGSGICEHGRVRTQCKDCCRASSQHGSSFFQKTAAATRAVVEATAEAAARMTQAAMRAVVVAGIETRQEAARAADLRGEPFTEPEERGVGSVI
jgi:regulator of protease activity HflC (stomatin/prohibitin superfamily)